MAANPQLVVALEAKLDKFEKDLVKAGAIAERAVASIEDKFARANPQFGSAFAGGALGGLLGAGAFHQVEQIAKQLLEVNNTIAKIGETASIAGVNTAELQGTLFALMSGGGASRATATSDLEKIATLAAETNRQETSLSKILDENKVKYSETLTFAEAIPKLSKLAADATAVQRLELSKLLGLSRETIEALSVGPDAFKGMEDGARAAGAIIDDELIKKADQFKKAWDSATASITTRFLAFLTDQKASFLDGVIEATKNDARILEEQIGRLTTKLTEIWTKFREGIGGSAAAPAPFGVGPAPTQLTVTPKEGGGGISLPSKDASSERDSFERALEQARKRVALMEADTATVGLNSEARERARVIATLQEAAIRANTAAGLDNTAVTEEQRIKIEAMADAALAAAAKLRQAQEMVSAFKELGATFSEAFKGMVLEGKKLDEVLRNIGNRLASKAFDKLFDMLFTMAGGSAANSLFGGPRAAGGPVSVGKAYLVGERGPELFKPSISGSIIPRVGGSGGGPITINMHNAPANTSVGSVKQSRGKGGGVQLDVVFRNAVLDIVRGDTLDPNGGMNHALGAMGLDRSRGMG